MIKSVTIINYRKNELKITLNDVNPDHGIIIRKIDGLGPVKANININEYMISDGGLYNSSKLGIRNIVMDLVFTMAKTIEDVRQLTYNFFPLKRPLTFIIETDNRHLFTTGYVESNEPDIFSSQESTRISILCPDSYFYDWKEKDKVIDFRTVTSLFEFPFENNSLTNRLIELGEISKIREVQFDYDGDATIGCIFKFHCIGPVKNISLYHEESDSYNERMFLKTDAIESLTGSPLGLGDDIIVNTIVGQKSVNLYRDGETINVLNILDKSSDWINIYKGFNNLAYSAEIGIANLGLEITYNTIYEGI